MEQPLAQIVDRDVSLMEKKGVFYPAGVTRREESPAGGSPRPPISSDNYPDTGDFLLTSIKQFDVLCR